MKKKILFIVENDYFPRDTRVYNEANTLKEDGNDIFVLAPRDKKNNENKFEQVFGKFECYRHFHFEAESLKGLLFEYLIVFTTYAVFVPFLVLSKRIKYIHVANPPDFILLSFFWLKIFGVKFIYDVHDLSVETFEGKIKQKNIVSLIILYVLNFLKNSSIRLSDLIVSTNNSIKDIILKDFPGKKIYTVRNSNKIRYNSIEEINKPEKNELTIGYFGVINDDDASGYKNLAYLGKYIKSKGVKFSFEIIGHGSGLNSLKELVKNNDIENEFCFRGFVGLPEAFELVKQFDFGILPWPDIPKNNLHTAMKLMDYMCCGIPVCTLKLKEQMITTGGIGIHCDNFEEMGDEILRIYCEKDEYEPLRAKTLKYFNENLSWGIQETKLLQSYKDL